MCNNYVEKSWREKWFVPTDITFQEDGKLNVLKGQHIKKTTVKIP